jgi:hypothetical protein
MLDDCPANWSYIAAAPAHRTRHFLFYFRDEEFECDATDWSFHPQ